MIQDQQFWTSARGDPKHDHMFRCLLARLELSHKQTRGASTSLSPTTTTAAAGSANGGLTSSPLMHTPKPPSTRATPGGGGTPTPSGASHEPFGESTAAANRGSARGKTCVSEAMMRLLQHTMMYIAPVQKLRHTVPAMSLGWQSSCCVDGATQRFVTFGASKPAQVPDHLRFKACVAGDTYFAALTDNGEVWISGTLDGPANVGANNTSGGGSNSGATSSGGRAAGGGQPVENMRGVCGKTMQICGHGGRLFGLTTGFTMRPISTVSAGTRSLIPYRLVQFIDCGMGEDLYMIGMDSTIYKTTVQDSWTNYDCRCH